MDALDLDLLEGMYNHAIKDYSNNLASIPCTNSTQLDIIPRERSSKEIQKKVFLDAERRQGLYSHV